MDFFSFVFSKATFGILASVFVFVGGIPYLREIHQIRAHPHVLSWIGWAFITALGASAMVAEGSTWATAIVFANTALCIAIAVYSVVRGAGVWSTGLHDYVFFALGIFGLVLWQVLNLPVLALIFALLADLSFGIPTIVKTYKYPLSETPFAWAMFMASGFFGLLALRSLMFSEAVYPVYLFVFDSVIFLLTLKILNRRNQDARIHV